MHVYIHIYIYIYMYIYIYIHTYIFQLRSIAASQHKVSHWRLLQKAEGISPSLLDSLAFTGYCYYQ